MFSFMSVCLYMKFHVDRSISYNQCFPYRKRFMIVYLFSLEARDFILKPPWFPSRHLSKNFKKLKIMHRENREFLLRLIRENVISWQLILQVF